MSFLIIEAIIKLVMEIWGPPVSLKAWSGTNHTVCHSPLGWSLGTFHKWKHLILEEKNLSHNKTLYKIAHIFIFCSVLGAQDLITHEIIIFLKEDFFCYYAFKCFTSYYHNVSLHFVIPFFVWVRLTTNKVVGYFL